MLKILGYNNDSFADRLTYFIWVMFNGIKNVFSYHLFPLSKQCALCSFKAWMAYVRVDNVYVYNEDKFLATWSFSKI